LVVENLANTESRVVENSFNMERQAMKNSANMESRVIENLVNTENWVEQDSGGQETERRKRCYSKQKTLSMMVPKGYYQDTKCRLQKMHQRELAEKKEEEEQDYWFNCLRSMTKPKQTWREKWLAKEEGGSSGNNNGEEARKVSPARGRQPGIG
jgi:hypothetical protein